MHEPRPRALCRLRPDQAEPPEGPQSLLAIHPTRPEIRQAASSPRGLLLVLFLLLSPLPALVPLVRAGGEDAWREHLQGRQEEAVGRAREALREDPDDAAAAVALARALHELKRGDEAGAELDRLAQEHPSSGCGALGGGQLRLLETDAAAAESLLHLARSRFEVAGDARGEILAQGLLAEVHRGRGEIEEAEAILTSACGEAERIGWSFALPWLHLRLGSLLVSTRRHDEAVAHLEEAIRTARPLGATRWVGDAHMLLSVVARWRMDLDASLRHRQEALELYRRIGYRAGQARALHYLSGIYVRRGDLTRAMRLLREGLAAAKEAGSAREIAGCLGGLAVIDMLVGNDEAAIRGFDEALRSAGDSRGREWSAGMQSNLGLVYTNQERYGEALDRFERALEILRQVSSPRYEATILGNVGRCLCAMGRQGEGIERLEAAADLAREWNTPLTLAHALLDLGSCRHAQGDLASAEAAFLQATEVAKRTGYYEVQASVLLGRSHVSRARGRLDEALRLQEEAMAILEGVRARSRGATRVQAGFFGSVSHVYEDAVDLLWAMHAKRPEAGLDRRAFELAQRAKSRSLLDLLAEAEVDLRCRADPLYRERERGILEQIAELLESSGAGSDPEVARRAEGEIDRLEEELEVLEAQLRETDPRYAEIRYPRPLPIETVQETVLGEGELLLEYLLGDSASYLWAVTNERFRLVQLPPRDQIEPAVRQLLPMLSDYNLLGEDPTYFLEPVSALSRMLIGPVASELERARSVLIAPHGILHYLPFEVLLTDRPDPTGSTFATLPYLVRSLDPVYVPSISVLARLRRSQPERDDRPRLLLFGDPTWPAGQGGSVFGLGGTGVVSGRLPFAREEMLGIRDLFDRAETRLVAGGDATSAKLREAGTLGHYRLVHIAAHGLYNERRPRYSGLLLAPDPQGEGDGFLPVGEVFGLELPCDQLVLSACSSALGERVTGEGLVGLTRAFLHAGSRSVVAALWEVSGRATARFMTSFYGEIARFHGGDRAHALAQAKRRFANGEVEAVPGFARSSAHPYFWAAFVMTGDSR